MHLAMAQSLELHHCKIFMATGALALTPEQYVTCCYYSRIKKNVTRFTSSKKWQLFKKKFLRPNVVFFYHGKSCSFLVIFIF